MADKEMVGVRLPQDTHDRIEDYAEERGISKSDALRRLIEKGVDLEDAGLAVAASTMDDETDKKNQMTPDTSVVRPMLQFFGAFYGGAILLIFTVLLAGVSGYRYSIVPYGELLGIMFSIAIMVSAIMVLLYTKVPEKVDLIIHSKVDSAQQKYRQLTT